jgi:hypothetical protein
MAKSPLEPDGGHPPEPDQRVELVGPFQEHRLVIDGWRVPLVTGYEEDGGLVNLVIDHRLALVVDAAHFDRVARFLADVIGTCWGYGAHPNSDEWYENAGLPNPFDDPAIFRQVPHFTLRPHRVVEITSVHSDEDDNQFEAEQDA